MTHDFFFYQKLPKNTIKVIKEPKMQKKMAKKCRKVLKGWDFKESVYEFTYIMHEETT